MGASWRPGAAALLLVLASALGFLPAASAGTAAAPELTDPAGDQAVDSGTVPVLPGVNEETFDDVDLIAAWVEERQHDCAGQAEATCPAATLVVQTTAGWASGTMTVAFTVKRGPQSLPASTATAAGTPFTLTLNGTAVSGLDNASAANAADGLRITLPLAGLGATGGDVLSGLTLSTTRTDGGLLVDVPQDDQTGTDDAGPGSDYTFARPPVAPQLLLDIVSIDGKSGPVTVTREDATLPVVLRITNIGLDDDAYQLSFQSTPPLQDPPAFAQAFTPIGAGESDDATVQLSLDGMREGRISLIFFVTSERGASENARSSVTIDLPAAPPPPAEERAVKPAGLTFLTPAAEGLGFDGPFGSYAELALLALLVLVVIVLLFLLLALGRTTMEDEPAAEAPAPAPRTRGGTAGPTGVMETVHASDAPPALFEARDEAADAPADEAMSDVDPAALAAALAPEPDADDAEPEPVVGPPASGAPRIRIEEVRHTPREPDAGQRVTTEVILRNDGSSTTLRVALTLDGSPAAERTVLVPAHATKAVELAWTAGPGDNRVKISAYPA